MKTAAKNQSTVIAWIAWFVLSVLGYWAFHTIFPGPDVYGCG